MINGAHASYYLPGHGGPPSLAITAGEVADVTNDVTTLTGHPATRLEEPLRH